MEIQWVRGSETVKFSLPYVWFTLGVRGCGKSTFLESVGVQHLKRGNIICDMYGSRDGEGLAWLRSPLAEDKRILLVCSENASVKCSYDVKATNKLTLHDLESHDIIISAAPLYMNPGDEYINLALLTDLLGRRAVTGYKKLIYGIVRECSSLYYSRLKRTENQILAKAEMIFTVRESRHSGLSLGLDTLRFTGVDVEIRCLADFVILKTLGMFGLPRDLKWLYSVFQPFAFRRMPKQNFYILSKEGAIGLGLFHSIPWHKQEKENLLKELGIKIEFGEAEEKGDFRGEYRTCGDSEHAEMIRLHIEEGLSFNKIAEKINRSSRTPFSHIHLHNKNVEVAGFCPSCRRVKSQLDKTLARRG